MTALLVLALLQSAPPAAFPELSKLAEDARRANRNDEALQHYQKALRLKPSWAEGWWNTGVILYEKERYAEARDALRKLIELDEKAIAGYALLGICEYKIADYDAALRHLDIARMLGLPLNHPLAESARYYLGVLLNKTGLHEAAMDQLLSLATKAEATPAIFEALGSAGLRLAKLPFEWTAEEKELAGTVGQALAAAGQEGLPVLGRLVKLHPAYPNLHYVHGLVLLKADNDQALDEFRKELEIQPRSVHTLLALARQMELRRNPEEARDFAERAVRAAPGDFAAHALLGRLLTSLGRVQDGVEELEKARAIEPASPQVYFSLASSYAKLGRNAEAEKARQEFLRLKKIADAQP